MTPFVRVLAAAACLSALAGCITAPPPPGVTYVHASTLSGLVEAGAPQLTPTDTGTLRAVLPLKNLAKGRLMIEGRATFVGDRGQTVEAPSGWQHVFIEPDSAAVLQFQSMASAARQVTIELREGNR